MERYRRTGVKRMNINLPVKLHDAFKTACAARGQRMTDVLARFIQDYVDKHLPAALRKELLKG